MKTFGFVLLCLLALIGAFALFGAARQWWINPARKLDRTLRKIERQQKQKER